MGPSERNSWGIIFAVKGEKGGKKGEKKERGKEIIRQGGAREHKAAFC